MDTLSFLIGKKAGGGGGTPPVYQDKEITITTNGEQTIRADSGYDALSSVEITTSVPQPSGKITITQNGTDIDVSSYASADVNVPAGADLSEYFNSTIDGGQKINTIIKKVISPLTVNGTSMSAMFSSSYLTEIPEISNLNNITNFYYCFDSCDNLVSLDWSSKQMNNGITSLQSMFSNCDNLEEVNLSSLTSIANNTNLASMFQSCPKLKKVNMSGLNIDSNTKSIGTSGMFRYSTALEEIDLSSFNFSKIGNSGQMFGASASDGPADNCLIYVKDQTAKDWFTTNFSRFTNVQIKGA